jgi:membrane associated rhomboid family serine protease
MTTSVEHKPVKTWKPTVAGVLCIIAGVIAIVLALWTFRRHEVLGQLVPDRRWRASGLFILILAIMSITGGIFALLRKAWGVALAGAITALYAFGIFGILAIIFVTLAKDEFGLPADKDTVR